jgi:hypothetical protein
VDLGVGGVEVTSNDWTNHRWESTKVAVDDTIVHGRGWLRKHVQSPDVILHEAVERLSVATSRFASDTWLR